MRLAEIFAELDREAQMRTAKPAPEAVCSTLRDVAARYARANPFKAGDLVTPGSDSDMRRKGEPNIVLEVRDRPEPDFSAVSANDCVSNAYGRRVDMRVASIVGDSVTQHWVESWQFESYRGPGSEAAAA